MKQLESDKRRNILKDQEPNNKKEEKTIMWPFKKKDVQRGWSIFFIIIGLLLMIIKPISNTVNNIGINAFIAGLIISFVGFFYFMDIQ